MAIADLLPGLESKERLDRSMSRLGRPVRIMEICGTHTHVIGRAGLRTLFPEGLELISGPGCPVCVTAQRDIERLLLLAAIPGITLCTFGDMIRVPGHTSSLERQRAAGADIRVVYSPHDALELARMSSELNVLFAGIGFETTAPTVAATILRAAELDLRNFWCVPLHKRLLPAMEALVNGTTRLDGFLTPGHVSVIIGAEAFASFAIRRQIPCVATGFAPEDIMEGLTLLIDLLAADKAGSYVQYRRAIRPGGNDRARATMDTVFEPGDAEWRGLGLIPASGLRLRKKYERFDAAGRFEIPEPACGDTSACQCGDVLRGLIAPDGCPRFGKECTPRSPMGPCMVSSEGSCAARYRYG